MLCNDPGKKLNCYVPDYVVFDLETTGVSCRTDAVVEISALKVLGGQVVDEFSTLVNPQQPISFGASMVNGITDEMVADSPTFDVVLEAFLAFAGDAVLVGHNIHSFDIKFLQRDAQKYWGLCVGNDTVDTLPLSQLLLPRLPHHRLVDLADHYGISSLGAHRALNDCRMNQQVFECLAREMQKSPFGLVLCPKCGQAMVKRNGKYGEFWGCSGYPDCRGTRKL